MVNILNKRTFFTVFFFLTALSPAGAEASAAPACGGADRACLFKELGETAAAIEDSKWRDISYRELAKSLAADKRLDDAIALIGKIATPDTQALTIRGIGMAAAKHKLTPEQYDILFKTLAREANKITQQASKDIAYTYIAMSQSFALQDQAAIATARAMTNEALKHKAFGEIAEVQAERPDAIAAFATLKEISSQSYRNKSTRTITLLLADRGLYNEASQAAHQISNPTLRAEALQYILTKQMAVAE